MMTYLSYSPIGTIMAAGHLFDSYSSGVMDSCKKSLLMRLTPQHIAHLVLTTLLPLLVMEQTLQLVIIGWLKIGLLCYVG